MRQREEEAVAAQQAAPSTDTGGAEIGKLDPKIWKICAVVLLAPLMTQLDSTIVNVSLSTIRHDLHASISDAQWIIGGYLLALALTLPLNAWLVERLGAKRLYLWCFSAFTLASLLCGAATTLDQLVASRILQGAAGGLLAPMTQMMMARTAGRHMARVMGYTAIPILIGPILGPSVAGLVLHYADWPWLFYINLPIGILAVALAAWMLPADVPSSERSAFDFVGFFLISPALVLLLYGLDNAVSRNGDMALVTGAGLLACFVWHGLRKKQAALLNLQLFRVRIFSIAAMTQLLANAATYGGQFLVPLYLIVGCGFAPVKAGLILAAMGLGMLSAYPSMGFLIERFGCRKVAMTGAFLNVVGTLGLLWMTWAGYSSTLMFVCLVIRGAGQGSIGVPSISAAYASVPGKLLGQAATAANILQRLGGPIGTTLLAMIVAATEVPASMSGPHVFTLPFAGLLAIQLLVLFSTSRLPLRVPQHH